MSADSASLTCPSVRYRESFLAALAEYHREDRLTDLSLADLSHDFEGYVAKVRAREDPSQVAADYVPETTFWLVDNDVYVGRLSIRHTLNDDLRRIGGHISYVIRPGYRRQGYGNTILRLGLVKARPPGLKRVLLTCDVANQGSRKIIEPNGGTLVDAIMIAGRERSTCHYWIDL